MVLYGGTGVSDTEEYGCSTVFTSSISFFSLDTYFIFEVYHLYDELLLSV